MPKKRRRRKPMKRHGTKTFFLKELMSRLGVNNPIVIECGAGPWLECEYILPTANAVHLVEPVKELADLHEGSVIGKVRAGVEVRMSNVAIHPTLKEVTMKKWPKLMQRPNMKAGGSYVVESGWNPLRPGNQHYTQRRRDVSSWEEFKVKAVPFSEIDPTNANIVILDMEGSEWFALQDMVSRPELIFIEMHNGNPFMEEIEDWMATNGYNLHAATKGNRYYVKR